MGLYRKSKRARLLLIASNHFSEPGIKKEMTKATKQLAKIRQFLIPITIAMATGNTLKSAAIARKIPQRAGRFFVAAKTATAIRKSSKR